MWKSFNFKFSGTPLDYEEASSHKLYVEARDGGVNSLPVYATVIINVIDVNDNSPQISVSFLEETATPSISEDAVIGSFVAFVSVTDKDIGQAGVVHTVLEYSDDFELQTVDSVSNRYMLKTKSLLDRERIGKYSLKITAVDEGTPSLKSTETIEILITDVNDNSPFFHQSQYRWEKLQFRENKFPKLVFRYFDRYTPIFSFFAYIFPN